MQPYDIETIKRVKRQFVEDKILAYYSNLLIELYSLTPVYAVICKTTGMFLSIHPSSEYAERIKSIETLRDSYIDTVYGKYMKVLGIPTILQ